MTMLVSQITSLTVVYSIVYSGVNQRKHQSSASLAFVREIHRGPVNFPHKWPVTRKMFPFDGVITFDDVIMGTKPQQNTTQENAEWMIKVTWPVKTIKPDMLRPNYSYHYVQLSFGAQITQFKVVNEISLTKSRGTSFVKFQLSILWLSHVKMAI